MPVFRSLCERRRLETLAQQRLKVQGFTALYAKNRYYDPLERSTWVEEVVFVERKGELYRLELQCSPDQIDRFEPGIRALGEHI